MSYFFNGHGAYGDDIGWGSGGGSQEDFDASGDLGELKAIHKAIKQIQANCKQAEINEKDWQEAIDSDRVTTNTVIVSVRQLFKQNHIKITPQDFYDLVEKNRQMIESGVNIDEIESRLTPDVKEKIHN